MQPLLAAEPNPPTRGIDQTDAGVSVDVVSVDRNASGSFSSATSIGYVAAAVESTIPPLVAGGRLTAAD
jgi:hypothetical protein